MPNKNKITVVIPTYQYQLNRFEQISFDRIYNKLSKYNITLLKPHSLDFRHLQKDYPLLHIESFDESFFHGNNAHNRLMLSEEFYERFAGSDYLLLAKLDVYIFEDKLFEFCEMGYDYISSLAMKKKSFFSSKKNKLYEQKIVGCENIALRKIESHLNALKKHQAKKEDYLKNEKDENLFWTTEIPEFSYPSPTESLSFVFDQQPEQCYTLNNRELPFACCNWHQKGKQNKFWEEFIKV